jgi:uroporphyrinogen decarboxylase
VSRRLVDALRGEPVDRTPVWVMRQAGRHLPEYRELRATIAFQDAVATPEVAAEITLQPIERYGMDGAVIFADIMTPLEAMGVEMTFDPGPKLRPHTMREIAALPALDVDRVGFVCETIRLVRAALPDDVAVVGFAGAPATLLAYLVEGGGSKDFLGMRGAVRVDPGLTRDALAGLAHAMQAYLRMQIEAGADVVQLFDSWAGLHDVTSYRDLVAPAARATLAGLTVPRIYFAPGAGHTLDLQPLVAADAHGVDWRIPIDVAWDRVGSRAIQGNLDPAVLLAAPDVIEREVADLMDRIGGRPGHVANLGHGIHESTPPGHVAAFVDAVRSR